MQSGRLTVDIFLDHAAAWHGDREVVSRSSAGQVHRSTYKALRHSAKQVSAALLARDIRPGDRIATLGWNSHNHVAAWYGIVGIGAICHTVNPRLFLDQLIYIVNHAQDRLILADAACAVILEALLSACPSVKQIVFLDEVPAGAFPIPVTDFAAWTAEQSADTAWGRFDEQTPCGLCYSSGTTGDPKGALYTHRSNYLHTLFTLQPDALDLSASDTILPVVPLYHANAWGLVYSAPAVGAKLVLPGQRLDPASLHELIETEQVTWSAGVPTVWQMLLQYLEMTGGTLSTLRKIVIGGSACPGHLIHLYRDKYGIEVGHAWGMTEASPLVTVSKPNGAVASMSDDEQHAFRCKQGRLVCGLDMKLVNDSGRPLPHDGTTFGRVMIKGPTVIARYYGLETTEILDEDGFFDTGDIATIDPLGYLQVVDRAKDVIKSGGEWISSVEIETKIAAHPKVALAAVIGVPHEKWDERPLLLVQLRPGEQATAAELLAFLDGKIARWWMPDAVEFVEQIPLGATGKIDKKVIRARPLSVS